VTPVPAKPWYQSKTVVVNALLLVAFALGLIGQNAGALNLDPRWVIGAGMGVLFVNEALRLVTSVPISGTPAAAAAKQASAPQPAVPLVDVGDRVAALQSQRDAINAQLEQIDRIASAPGPQPALPASPVVAATESHVA
jgi:hypothetical protein